MTDRDNQRIEVFDANGKFLTEWTNTGGVSGLAMTGDGRIVTGAVVRDLKGNVFVRLPEATAAHGATVDQAGNIYLAQLTGIVQKYREAVRKVSHLGVLEDRMYFRRISTLTVGLAFVVSSAAGAFAQDKPQEKPKRKSNSRSRSWSSWRRSARWSTR